jgi:hypothetical protein
MLGRDIGVRVDRTDWSGTSWLGKRGSETIAVSCLTMHLGHVQPQALKQTLEEQKEINFRRILG